jgi:hypothetical protein
VVERLLECRHIDINHGWGGHFPPLLAAISVGHTGEAMRVLACEDRLDINAQTYQKESALSLAARNEYLQVVGTILQGRRADRNSVDDQGRTALWWAAHKGQTAVVRRLLEDAHLHVDVKDNLSIHSLSLVLLLCIHYREIRNGRKMGSNLRLWDA